MDTGRVTGNERAPKRRRLNNGDTSQNLNPDADNFDSPRHDFIPISFAEGIVPPSTGVSSRTQPHSQHEPAFRQLDEAQLAATSETHSPAPGNTQRGIEAPFGILLGDLGGHSSGPATRPSFHGAGIDAAESPGLPFGMLNDPRDRLINSHTAHSAVDPRVDHSTRQLADMAGLEAIDLTTVNDRSALREREELDDEARRIRREASMKIEARRKANAQMLKSTLEQQQSESASLDNNAEDKGLGSMQCVICMDHFTDMTATHCGHIFCHTCINEHLITAAMSRGYPTIKALCPFCRTAVSRKGHRQTDKDKGIVPLIFKVKPQDNQHSHRDKPNVESVD